MMKRISILLTMCWLTLSVWAQCSVPTHPVAAGETLGYKLKFNWKFIWVNAGWAEMTVKNVTHDGSPALKVNLLSYTSKKVDRFFKMRDTLTAITTPDLIPIYFRKGAEEGKHYKVDKVQYTYAGGKTIIQQERTVDNKETERREDTVTRCVYDMISLMMRARAFDVTSFQVGQKINLPMATGREIEEQTLIYRGKKEYKAEDDVTYRCLVFSLVEYTAKKKEKEVITFYVTDDQNHLPVRLDLYLNFGSAKAFLTEIKGNKYPLTSIVKKK